MRRTWFCLLTLGIGLLMPRDAGSQSVVPAVTDLPQVMSLEQALRVFHERGLDLLIADANARNAEGTVLAARAVPNPSVSTSVGLDPA